MAALTEVISPTVRAVETAALNRRRNFESIGIGFGMLGDECDARIWFGLRWTHEPEVIDGRKARLFETGNREEARLVDDLAAAGVEITRQQERHSFVGGHVRGKIDGVALGVVEAPATPHLAEFKTHNDESFKALKKKGLEVSKPAHFAQCQLGAAATGMSRIFYLAANKNDDTLHVVRTPADPVFALTLQLKGERIVTAHVRPPKQHEDPEAKGAFRCKVCPARGVCHDGEFSRRHCRTCIHATSHLDGDARWSCERHKIPTLSIEAQRTGCPNHLYLPDLVPGEQVDADAEAETITYKLRDGSTWVDGGKVAP